MTDKTDKPDNPGNPIDGAQAAPLLVVQDLGVCFGRLRRDWRGRICQQPVPALSGVSFEVPSQSVVALVGESGSGKSVSAMAIMGLLPPDARLDGVSRIHFDGRPLLAPGVDDRAAVCGRTIAMIFQDPMSSLNPVFTVGFQIGEVLRLHKGMGRDAARQRAIALLEEVGIGAASDRIDAYPWQLSGGQQQRVMIAMALACEPRLLIADEPTTALDVTVQKQIIALLARLRVAYRMSVLFITHDLGLVAEVADAVVVMRQGAVLESGPVTRVFGQPAHPYTRALLHCRPGLQQSRSRLPVIDDFLRVDGAEAVHPDVVAVAPLPQEATPILQARGLCRFFGAPVPGDTPQERAGLRDISLTLARGRTLGVVGESGSGKSTLARTLLRLQRADAGQVLFDGRDLLALPERAFAAYRRRLQIVFQNPYASLNPRFTVQQILTEPMQIHGIGANPAQRRQLALQLLDRVGLPATSMARHPHQFSGGQRQRIAIARCLALRPEVLICDESVSALDVSVQAQVLNLLVELQQELGLAYVFISHDLAVIRHMAHEVLVLRGGQVVEAGPADVLLSRPRHPYTQALLDAVLPGPGKTGMA